MLILCLCLTVCVPPVGLSVCLPVYMCLSVTLKLLGCSVDIWKANKAQDRELSIITRILTSYYTRSVTSILHPYCYICVVTPVLLHPYYTRIITCILHSYCYACIVTSILHQYCYVCIVTPVLLHLYCYICIFTPVLLHPHVYTRIVTPTLLHLYFYICIVTQKIA